MIFTPANEPDADDGRRARRSLEHSANREELAVELDRASLRVAPKMLSPEGRIQINPPVRGEPERREEAGFESTERMSRRQQVTIQLDRIDYRPIGIRKQHDGILAVSVPWIFADAGQQSAEVDNVAPAGWRATGGTGITES